MVNNKTNATAHTVKASLIMLFLSIGFISGVLAEANELPAPTLAPASAEAGEKFDMGAFMMHHVLDDYNWHFWDGPYGTLYLPVIAYTSEKGLSIFSSHQLYNEDHSEGAVYEGYLIDHARLARVDGASFYNFSITKNVAMLFVVVFVLLFIALKTASFYKNNKNVAPKGLASFIEPLILFVRDDIARANIGEGKADKYVPYLLTVFLFILFGNLMGLLPGAANLTGNIAVTMTLALLTFIIVNVSGSGYYWHHLFTAPGVPGLIKIIIIPVELLGLFTKPFALMVRLFVAITAGHFVVMGFILIGVLFQSFYVGLATAIVALVINIVEIMVAGIQAYIFTLFTALYLGMSVDKGHAH